EVRARVLELGHERVVGGAQHLGGEVSSRYALLIGHDDGCDTGGFETANGLGRARQEPEARWMVHVPDLFRERPVAVDEDSGAMTHSGSLCSRRRLLKENQRLRPKRR